MLNNLLRFNELKIFRYTQVIQLFDRIQAQLEDTAQFLNAHYIRISFELYFDRANSLYHIEIRNSNKLLANPEYRRFFISLSYHGLFSSCSSAAPPVHSHLIFSKNIKKQKTEKKSLRFKHHCIGYTGIKISKIVFE